MNNSKNINPSIACVQFTCISIKISIYEDHPVRLDSPLEAYSCIGRIAKAYKLPMPESQDTLYKMREKLNQDILNRPTPSEMAARMLKILNDLNRDYDTDGVAMNIVEYAYEHES